MADRRRRIFQTVSLVAAAVAILFAGTGIVAQRNENISLRSDLTSCEERNGGLFQLLVASVSNGSLPLEEIAPYVSDVEAAEIAERAAEAIQVSLPFDLEAMFYPSGWMGDGESGTEYLSFRRQSARLDGEEVIAVRIEYSRGPNGWAGIYWQSPENNWGDRSGRVLLGASRISFYARGERGGEIVEFKSGGISGGRYRDSFERSLGKLSLRSTWNRYEIDLSGEDLSSVIGAFAWIAAASDNEDPVVIYLAKLTVE